MKTNVDDELDRLQSANIIEPVTYSQWATTIVTILKSDCTVRICGDYKVTVNRFAHIEQYPLPTPEDLFATLAAGVLFSKLDNAHAYQQILIDDDSKQYLTINTHRGLFVYNRPAFEVSSAPAIFLWVIKNLLADVHHIVVYLDDILVTGASEGEHQAKLKEVLRRLTEAAIRLKKDKCNFGVAVVEYLGHRMRKDGLATLDKRVCAVGEAPTPKNVTQIKLFLGIPSIPTQLGYDPSTIVPTVEERSCLHMGYRSRASIQHSKGAYMESPSPDTIMMSTSHFS